jgi:peptidylprolyl isomerase/peptidyl-prolyl cis-trans isomerase D
MKVEPSAKTRNQVYKDVQNFHKRSLEIGLDSAAQIINMEVRKTASFNKKSTFVPGIGQHSRLVRFAFENDSTVVSDIISTQQGNGVFRVMDIRDEGTKPFKEIEASLKARTLRAKKMERLRTSVEQLRTKLSAGDTLGKLRTFDTTINVLKAGAFTLNGSVTGIGRDLYFLGAVSQMNNGDISPIVESPNRGFFIIRVIQRTPFDSTMYASQKETLRKQLYDAKRNKFMNEWLQNLKTEATIVDNRDAFFR